MAFLSHPLSSLLVVLDDTQTESIYIYTHQASLAVGERRVRTTFLCSFLRNIPRSLLFSFLHLLTHCGSVVPHANQLLAPDHALTLLTTHSQRANNNNNNTKYLSVGEGK